MGRVGGEVIGFGGVGDEVEELGVGLAVDAVFDEFEAFVAQGALPGHEGGIEVVAVGGGGVFESRVVGLELHSGGDVETGAFAEGGVDVVKVAELVAGFALRDAGTGEEEGDAEGVVVSGGQ